jgi:hypothetical protein
MYCGANDFIDIDSLKLELTVRLALRSWRQRAGSLNAPSPLRLCAFAGNFDFYS